MSQSPYQPPNPMPPEPSALPPQRQGTAAEPWVGQPPKSWIWYRVYCAFMALLYILVTVIGVGMTFAAESFAGQAEEEVIVVFIQGLIFSAVGLVLFVLFAVALLSRPSKFAWYLGFATIGLGMTSVCCLPATIPLLIFWVNEDTRRFLNTR